MQHLVLLSSTNSPPQAPDENPPRCVLRAVWRFYERFRLLCHLRSNRSDPHEVMVDNNLFVCQQRTHQQLLFISDHWSFFIVDWLLQDKQSLGKESRHILSCCRNHEPLCVSTGQRSARLSKTSHLNMLYPYIVAGGRRRGSLFFSKELRWVRGNGKMDYWGKCFPFIRTQGSM